MCAYLVPNGGHTWDLSCVSDIHDGKFKLVFDMFDAANSLGTGMLYVQT